MELSCNLHCELPTAYQSMIMIHLEIQKISLFSYLRPHLGRHGASCVVCGGVSSEASEGTYHR